VNGLAGLLPILLLGVVFWGLPVPALGVLGASLITGALFNYQMLPYFKALQITDASRVVPLYQFTPFFALVFAYLFLHESLSYKALIALVLLVLGGFIISIEKVEGVFRLSKALLYMLCACILYALYLTLSRYVYLHVSYFTGMAWQTIGGFISVAPLLLVHKTRHDVRQVVTTMSNKIKSLFFTMEALNLLAILSVQLALVSGPAALVGALGGIQPLYILVLTALVSTWLPKILKEDTAWRTLAHKSFAVILIIAGVALVTV